MNFDVVLSVFIQLTWLSVCAHFRCVCVSVCVCVRALQMCVCACVRALQMCVRVRVRVRASDVCSENFSHSARLLLQQSRASSMLTLCLRGVLISSPDT